MHPEVDNEEGSTICLYKSMAYGIMHNLRNTKRKYQKNQSVNRFISVPRTTLFQYQERHYKVLETEVILIFQGAFSARMYFSNKYMYVIDLIFH